MDISQGCELAYSEDSFVIFGVIIGLINIFFRSVMIRESLTHRRVCLVKMDCPRTSYQHRLCSLPMLSLLSLADTKILVTVHCPVSSFHVPIPQFISGPWILNHDSDVLIDYTIHTHNTVSFHLSCHVMTTFHSCHLIINRKLTNDCRYVRDFIDADFHVREVLLLHF